MGEPQRIRPNSILPARREAITLTTADGLELVGELALPATGDPVATMVCLHPLPTHGGMMDSQIFRKAAARLPALAQLAVLRFNTRGTTSVQGTSEGEFDHAQGEQYDVAAAIEYAEFAELPNIWVVGWSFGTDLALMYASDPASSGRSCCRRRCATAPTRCWPRGARATSRWSRSFPSSTTTCALPRRESGSRPSRTPR